MNNHLLISIHALLAESDSFASFNRRHGYISIHALLAESDTLQCVARLCYCNFYPRSPCGERRILWHALTQLVLFLSTLSLRRATCVKRFHAADMSYFYPRSPCGERQFKPPVQAHRKDFYPRSPCGERLLTSVAIVFALLDFYPRSPCGERPRAKSGQRH